MQDIFFGNGRPLPGLEEDLLHSPSPGYPARPSSVAVLLRRVEKRGELHFGKCEKRLAINVIFHNTETLEKIPIDQETAKKPG